MADRVDGSSTESEGARAAPDGGSFGPHTEGVRISAVEAAVAAGLAPSTSRAPVEPAPPESTVALPDWTDPPTGQVPRVLLGDEFEHDGDDLLSGLRGPTWRQHGSDWEDDTLDLSFLSEDGPDPRIATSEFVGDDVPLDLAFEDLEVPSAPPPRTVAADEDPSGRPLEPHAGKAGLHGGRDGSSSTSPTGATDDGEGADDAAWAALLGSDPESMGDLGGAPPARPRRSAARRGARFPRANATPRAPGGAVLADAPAVAPSATVPVTRPSGATAPKARAANTSSATAGDAEARERGRRGSSAGPDPAAATGSRVARAREPSRRDPVLATVTGLVAGAIAIGVFAAGAQASLVLVALLVTVATGELLGTLRSSGRRPATPLALLAAPALVVGSYLRGPAAWPLVLGLAVVLAMAWYLLGTRGERPAIDLGVTFLSIFWVGGLGSFAGLLLAPGTFPHRHGVGFLAAGVALTVASDVGAYAVGARFGKHKLAPEISPSKSVEGLIAGAVLTMVVAVLVVSHIHPLDVGKALVIGAVVAVFAPLGDLAESLVKRDVGVKDMGSVLPAHGGVLDRIDGMLFVLPALYYLVEAFHLS